MTYSPDLEARSANSGRFEALIQKLVAIQSELDAVCGAGQVRNHIGASLESIAEPCDVLRSAIADLRNIIGEFNGLADRPESLYG